MHLRYKLLLAVFLIFTIPTTSALIFLETKYNVLTMAGDKGVFFASEWVMGKVKKRALALFEAPKQVPKPAPKEVSNYPIIYDGEIFKVSVDVTEIEFYTPVFGPNRIVVNPEKPIQFEPCTNTSVSMSCSLPTSTIAVISRRFNSRDKLTRDAPKRFKNGI